MLGLGKRSLSIEVSWVGSKCSGEMWAMERTGSRNRIQLYLIIETYLADLSFSALP